MNYIIDNPIEKNKSTFYFSLIVALVAVAFGAILITTINSDYENLVASSEKSLDTTPKANSGSVWAILKEKGLQGDHFTLNIHGKKDDFNKTDCTVVQDPITLAYSNNIFVPSNSTGEVQNQILITSGNAKGKFASTAPVYGVRDACTAAFDNDAAELVLPPNDKGYYVVARVLGKPTNDPAIGLEGDLVWVKDENGQDLLVLGLVTDQGFQTPEVTLSRTKGKVYPMDITGLFEWTGSVCYFETANYCGDGTVLPECTIRNTCCQDSDLDTIFETCVAPALTTEGLEYCAEGYSLLSVGCRDYTNEWVFNIGDMVGYMWDTYTDGDFKLVNIRFYPVK